MACSRTWSGVWSSRRGRGTLGGSCRWARGVRVRGRQDCTSSIAVCPWTISSISGHQAWTALFDACHVAIPAGSRHAPECTLGSGRLPPLITFCRALGCLLSVASSPSSHWLVASMARRGVFASQRPRRGRSESGRREQPPVGCRPRGEAATTPTRVPGTGRAGGSTSAASAPHVAWVNRVPAAASGPRGQRMQARQCHHLRS